MMYKLLWGSIIIVSLLVSGIFVVCGIFDKAFQHSSKIVKVIKFLITLTNIITVATLIVCGYFIIYSNRRYA